MSGAGEGASPADTVLRTCPLHGVWLLQIARPHARNAVDVEAVARLGALLGEAAANDAVRCVVLTGNAAAFCAGSDIKEMLGSGIACLRASRRSAAWKAIESFPKPLIAAVEGVCFGAGNELAMVADIIVAGEAARFAQPEVRIGVLPGDGGTQRLVRAVGKSMAMKMILTGEPVDARTAMAAGLVAEVVEAGTAVARALALADLIAANAPIAVALAKQAIGMAQSTPLDAGLELERRMLEQVFTTSDREEGMRAFAEKRPPRFQGI